VHAAWLLHSADALETELLRTLLRDSNPRFREQGLCLLADMKELPNEVAGLIPDLGADPDPRVRFQAVLTMDPEVIGYFLGGLFTAARHDVSDPWLRRAIASAAYEHPEHLLRILLLKWDRFWGEDLKAPGRLALIQEL